MPLVIVEIPIPYHGFAVLPGKRSEDECLLVATVPVHIPDAPADSLALAATLTCAPVPHAAAFIGNEDPVAHRVEEVSYWTDGHRLFTPMGLRNPLGTEHVPYPSAPTPPDQIMRIGFGGSAFHAVRGIMTNGGTTSEVIAAERMNTRGRYPFSSHAMNCHTWGRHAPVSVHPEDGNLRQSREATPGARDMAIAFARRAASEMLTYQGFILEPTPGPMWRIQTVDFLPNQAPVTFLEAIHDPEARFPRQTSADESRWAKFVSPLLESEARIRFEAAGYSVVHRGSIEILRPEALTHDTAGVGLVEAARNVTNPETGVKMLALAPAALGEAWFNIRDAVNAIPPGGSANARLCEAVARFNALVGPERTEFWMVEYAAAARQPSLLPGYGGSRD